MAVQYEAHFHKKNDELILTQVLPDGSTDTKKVDLEKISEIQKLCQSINWRESVNVCQEIGEKLFFILNGDQLLVKSLEEADKCGELLQVLIRIEFAEMPDLPFEVLYYSGFLAHSRIHLIRRISDYGCKKMLNPRKDPLRVLFIACSPEGGDPVLNFEKEEESIFEVTKDLPVDIDVEDTGSLEGLKDCLEYNEYDVIHLSGHAGIDEKGPFFEMEDELGYPAKVRSAELGDTLSSGMTPPRLIFLSGCRTGQVYAAFSFAQSLVAGYKVTVLGWGQPVSDPGATIAAVTLYYELSRGKNVLDAVLSARNELVKNGLPDWSLLRLFSDGTPLDVPLVEKGQKRRIKPRDIQYIYLENSQVKVLKKGFVGRRRQIQRGMKCLKKDEQKVGLLLHGTGGLGKSCLAGKLCERFKNHALIVVNGELNALTFSEALKHGFMRARDEEGQKILKQKEEITDKILKLCTSSFQDRNYLILLDDFEKNIENIEDNPVVSVEAAPILGALLLYLPYTDKMTQLIITSKYTFSFPEGEVKKRLESIGLTSFQGADERKKIAELKEIATYEDENIRKELIAAGRGNPRLMDILNFLLETEKGLDVTALLSRVQGKQEEFVQELILREILERQSEDFQMVLRRASVYRLPVLREGIGLVCNEIKDWKSLVELGVQLSLMEEDKRGDLVYYWVTPLLREEIFKELGEERRKWCHKAAVVYYKKVLSLIEGYHPIYAFELIWHALECGMDEIALERGERLLAYLRDTLAYREALVKGEYILSKLSKPKRDDKFALFLVALGWMCDTLGNPKKAIEYYEQALSIDREVYGEKHPDVARDLNNLGGAWHALGDPKKAIEYYEQALFIVRKALGEKHPYVASTLNNLGEVWRALGNPKKAIEYYEQALSIDREVYGEKHPDVARDLNNLGGAWHALGDPKKAIEYYDQALFIVRKALGEKHPYVASTLNNLGLTWHALGDPKKAIEYYDQALSIDREVYGERHAAVAGDLNNLGGAWHALGDPKKAIEYYDQALFIVRKALGEKHPYVASTLNNLGEVWRALGNPKKAIEYYDQALSIDREVYGEKHPDVATVLNNLGLTWHALGDPKKAIEYYEQALSIDREVYGEKHPDVASTLNNLGKAWHALGDPKKAIQYIQQAYDIFQEVYRDQHPYTKMTKKTLNILRQQNE